MHSRIFTRRQRWEFRQAFGERGRYISWAAVIISPRSDIIVCRLGITCSLMSQSENMRAWAPVLLSQVPSPRRLSMNPRLSLSPFSDLISCGRSSGRP